MQDQIISFETAKLAKEKGFEGRQDDGYMDDGSFGSREGIDGESIWVTNGLTRSVIYDFDYGVKFISAPTQSLLQKWLRDIHNIHIEILLEENSPYNKFYYRIMKLGQYFTLSHNGVYNKSYEEILEIALFEALEYVG